MIILPVESKYLFVEVKLYLSYPPDIIPETWPDDTVSCLSLSLSSEPDAAKSSSRYIPVKVLSSIGALYVFPLYTYDTISPG